MGRHLTSTWLILGRSLAPNMEPQALPVLQNFAPRCSELAFPVQLFPTSQCSGYKTEDILGTELQDSPKHNANKTNVLYKEN